MRQPDFGACAIITYKSLKVFVSKAVSWRSSAKQALLKISKNSQERTSGKPAEVSFLIKL